MNKEKIFKKVSAEHPEWTAEQVWSKVAIEIQADEAIENNKDLDPNDPGIWKSIITKARDWLKEIMPVIYEKVKEIFSTILQKLKEWWDENKHEIVKNIIEVITAIGASLLGGKAATSKQ